jgi:hypothetical protein
MLPAFFAVIAAALLAVAVYWLWRSARGLLLADSQSAALASANAERDGLLEEKTALLRALRDLQSDRDAGKLAQRDFERLDKRLRERTRSVLRALDAEIAPYRERARALLEEGAPDASPAAKSDAKSDAEASPSSSEPASSKPASEVLAHECGATNDPDAVFCKRCGARLAHDAEEPAS